MTRLTVRIVFAVIVIACAFTQERSFSHEPEPATKLKSMGCHLGMDVDGKVVQLAVDRVKLHDDDMRLVGQISSIERLYLNESPISDRGAAELVKLENLKLLDAGSTKLTDASMEFIAQFRGLESISLPPTITATGVRKLVGLKDLQRFTCLGPHIDDECVDSLLSFRRLTFVWLGPNVTPAGYERLSVLPDIDNIATHREMDDSMMAVFTRFPKLRFLNLANTRVTGAGLPHLRKLENLRTLTLPKCTTDAELAHIAHMRQLGQLDIRETQVTNAGMESLKGLRALYGIDLPPTTGDDAIAILGKHEVPIVGFGLLGPGYTDACIPTLLSLKKRPSLIAFGNGTRVTPEGVKKLQAALPGARIYLDD